MPFHPAWLLPLRLPLLLSFPLLKHQHSIAETPLRVAPPHGPKRLQKGQSIPALRDGKRPQTWAAHQRPADIPRLGDLRGDISRLGERREAMAAGEGDVVVHATQRW